MQTRADTILNIRRLILIPIVLGIGLGLALLLTAAAVSARPAPAQTHGPTKAASAQTAPSSYRANPPLTGVSALASGDVWAVGFYPNCSGTADQTLVEHWNGTAWSIVASPNVGSYDYLNGVSALASGDVWAVGYTRHGGANNQTLVEHWNGIAWSVVPSPSVGNNLLGVSAVASGDVWAVGNYVDASGTYLTLVEHWNGTAWSVVPSPNVGSSNNVLYGVSARASGDVWAVGYYLSSGSNQTLVEHWNGTAWSVVPSPDLGSSGNVLNGVSALASGDVWAVGYYCCIGDSGQTLVEHWNGTAWSVVASPNVGSSDTRLFGVSALASGDVWAVGSYAGGGQTLVEHWNGSAWSVVPSPNVGGTGNVLNGVSARASGDVWAVGEYFDSDLTDHTLVEHWNGSNWSVVVSPNPCPAGTPTPAPSPTPCTGFSDVHPADYFYTPVSSLASHGIISGYGDCTFRPYNNTTRSQMVKIVVLGFSIPLTTPAGGASTFQDVPASNPFFAVVETAAAHTIVSGYTCGQAPAGPCVPPQNRPYFLPYANVTRGQLSKIDVVAAGWPVIHPLTPTFSDVLPGSAFYPFVETAVCHGVVSGYADHSFRPGNNAIRGQIAKIVYLSVTTPAGSCPGATAAVAP